MSMHDAMRNPHESVLCVCMDHIFSWRGTCTCLMQFTMRGIVMHGVATHVTARKGTNLGRHFTMP